MKKTQLKFIFGAVFILLLLIILLVFILNTHINSEAQKIDEPIITPNKSSEEDNVEDVESQCKKLIKNNLQGLWRLPQPENDEDNAIFIFLYEDNTFLLANWIGSDYRAIGKWEFIPASYSLKFTFDGLDYFWSQFLQNSELKDLFTNILGYSYDQKYIELGLAYFEPTSNLTKCTLDRFYINLFNNNLYRVLDNSGV